MSSIPEIIEQRPPPGTLDENGWSFTRRWSVIAASEIDALKKLKSKLGVDRGTVFKNAKGQVPDAGVLLQRFTFDGRPPAPAGGQGQYIVEAIYSNAQPTPQSKPGGPSVWWVKGTIGTRPVDLDVKGLPIIYSSEEPVDPPLTKLTPQELLHGEFYVRAVDSVTAYMALRPYNTKLNLTPFFGAPQGSLLSHIFQTEPSDTGWVKVSIDLQFQEPKVLNGKRFIGWADVFPDRGYRKIVNPSSRNPDTRYERIVDAAGNPVSTPAYLDGRGQPLYKDIKKQPYLISAYHYTYVDFNKIPGMRIV
jgi:hypothetical protein